MDKVAIRETGEKKPYQLGGREGRVDLRRVVEAGVGKEAQRKWNQTHVDYVSHTQNQV